MRHALLLCLCATAAAAADDSSFEAADKYLREESNARACDGFTAFLKNNPDSVLKREATVKRAKACWRVGRSGNYWNELQQAATTGEKDFARAYACTVVSEQGYTDFATCLPLLKQAIGDDRVGEEARVLFVRGAFRDMDNNSYERKRVLDRVAQLLEVSVKPNERARARLYRARVNLRDPKTFSEGERESRDLGEGTTDVADDALFELGQVFEGQQKFVAALELFDAVVKRFSPQTSNVRESAQERAKEIRRPQASVSVSYIELPGMKPQVSFSYRNVENVKWTLRKVDPMQLQSVSDAISYEETAFTKAAGQTVSTWSAKLTVPSKHASGSSNFELDLKAAGAYLLEIDADGQHDQEIVLITPHATVLKIEQDLALTFTADAMSGVAVPNADVTLYLQTGGSSSYEKLTAKADATGVARFDLRGKQPHQAVAWTSASGSFSHARGYVSGWYQPTREHLGYVLLDRPLYKPGETVGLKVFLRSREDGPSVPLANAKLKLYVRDPSGKELANPELTTNAFGTAQFLMPLKADAQLGQYYAQLSVSDYSVNQAQATFRVEEYKPPEYTVSVAPLGPTEMGQKLKFKVSASFFFGGPVANAQGRALVQVRYWQHSFGPWGDEPVDDDPYGSRRGGYDEDEYGYRGRRGYGGQVAQHTLTFKTGTDGTAEVEVPALKPEQVAGWPGIEYAVQVFVTDASRREVSGQGSIKVSATPFFADLRADRFLYKPGEKIEVTLRAEDANGKPQDPELHVRLNRFNPNGGGATVIAKGKAKLSGGRGLLKLDADALGPVRIEVRASDANDAPVLAQSDVWLTNEAKPMMPEGYGFQLFTDRAPLKVGSMVRALVVAPTAGGHALVTIENEHLQWAKAVELVGRARFVEIPLSADMAPNSWLHVFRIEQVNPMQTNVEIRVKGSEVELPVKVAFQKGVTEPGTSVPVTIEAPGAPKGSQSEIAVTIVDEALYAIEAARTDFLSFFGRKRRELRVQTSSTMNQKSYRRPPEPKTPQNPTKDIAANKEPPPPPATSQPIVAEEAQKSDRAGAGAGAKVASAGPMGELAAAKPSKREESKEKKRAAGPADDADESPGGGGGAAPVKVRTDFGSSSGWFSSISGKAGTPAKQDVKLKDSLTSWRATAYVVTNGPHLGLGQGNIRTEKPLMVRLQAPRFFTERDEVTISGIVVSRLDKAADVDVSISAPGLKALGPAQKVLKVGPGQDVRFDVRFQVVDIGERTVKAIARSGPLTDAMEWKLPSMIHGSAQRKALAGRLSDKFSLEVELPEKRNAAATRFELTLSPSLLSVMFDSLPYLAQYPYGCVEQTLSRFVPAAIARRAVKDLNLPPTRVPDKLDDMVDAGLKRLYGFQHGDGGWGWWQTDNTNKWMSAYVVYGLGLGREAGLSVDASVLERGRSYLNGVMGSLKNEPETQAFATFALASTGGAPKNALDFAFSARTKLSPRGRALVALALLAAKDSRARIAVENLDDVVKAASARADAAVGEANDAWSTSAAIEATAYTLMAMARYDLKSPNLKPLTDFLVLRRNGGKWRTTRDTAFAIYALSDLARREEAGAKSGGFVVTVNGREVKRLKFTGGGIDLTAPIVLDDSAFKAGTNVIEVRKDGAPVTGYYAAIFDVFNQNDFIKGVGSDVVVSRKYTLLGKPSTEPTAAPTEYGMPLESGTRVRVDLEIKANKAVEFVMIEDLKPAGLEAVMQKSGPEVCNYQCAHAELRTDRVAMFLQAIPVGVTKLSYELRAEVPGKFAALPARAEAMYAPEIQATSDEMRFEVRDAPEQNLVGR